RALLDGHPPGGEVMHMTIGEPKHPFPQWVTDVIVANAARFNDYPANDGSEELLAAMAGWVQRRYGVRLEAETQGMARNGTGEGLYNAAMALCPEQVRGQRRVVVMPTPFYQVYMISAISVGAGPGFVPATAQTGFMPD